MAPIIALTALDVLVWLTVLATCEPVRFAYRRRRNRRRVAAIRRTTAVRASVHAAPSSVPSITTRR